MKKKIKIIVISFIITLIALISTTYGVQFKVAEYTEEYKKYLELTEAEKAIILEPRKYEIKESMSTNEAYLMNKQIPLKSYLNMLKASQEAKRSKYTLKDVIGENISIKDQMHTNTCWAFSALTSLETNLAMRDYKNQVEGTPKVYDFSERHMAYSMTQNFKEGAINPYGYSMEISDGGNAPMAIAYLTNGWGAINEEDMKFEDNENKISYDEILDKEVQTTLNNAIYFESIITEPSSKIVPPDLYNLRKQMKEHISTYGSIMAAMYFPEEGEKFINSANSAINVDNYELFGVNHAVSIIGWDDEYPKENFTIQPQDDGAWIITNSWGENIEITFEEFKAMYQIEDEEELEKILATYEAEGYIIDRENETISRKVGESGLYYVSYDDVWIYSNLMGIVNADDKKTYDNLYQVDELGANFGIGLDYEDGIDLCLANKFVRTSGADEYLTSIGITNDQSSATYEVYVNPNDADLSEEKLQKAELSTGDSVTLAPGYNTIELSKAFKLSGTEFAIVLRQIGKEGEELWLSLECNFLGQEPNAYSGINESFISTIGLEGGWTDIGIENEILPLESCGNLCIKGITQNEYTGEIANPNQEPTIPGDVEPEEIENSNFDDATIELESINEVDSELGYELKFVVRGIKVPNENVTYEHGFYLSTNKNHEIESNEDERWSYTDITDFIKQADGTYNLYITLTESWELEGLEDDVNSEDAYMYILEDALVGETISTKIYEPMKINVKNENLGENPGSTNNNNSGGGVASNGETNKKTSNMVAKSEYNYSPKILPKTGIGTIMIIFGTVTILAVVFYIKIKKMKDIK